MSVRKALSIPLIVTVAFFAVIAIAYVGTPRPRRKRPDNLRGERDDRTIDWETKHEGRSRT